MNDKTPEYHGSGRVTLPVGSFRLYPGRGWDSHYAEYFPPEPSRHLAWVMVSPKGYFMRWPDSRRRRWWLKRRGWVFYDGDGRRV